ncbi:hypothetical protein [Citricoccus muralis]|uniref:Uncharacterized protein n=1 Tax=Citricoccus muralis TaxID=169134 RepID=A0ABY8H4H5_9MICC|nr:hypothetical protein [Citricoccus muralis]WFP15749.1 hypothetical protein P8192_10115 [Citricoccus muralis]
MGRPTELATRLVAHDERTRRAMCRPLVAQAKAILSASSGSTVAAWLRHVRDDYPGGTDQFVDAWAGRLSQEHWDAATTVLLGAKNPAQAAKVWPVPEDHTFTEWVYPALFPGDLAIFVEQWSADFAVSPKNWDRNRGRAVMYEWIESGLVEARRHDGAVLMIIGGWADAPGKPLLRWLLARPRVTNEVFARLFDVRGVKGASLMQADQTAGDDPIRTVVVPGLMKRGVWTRDFVVRGTQSALESDLPAYQRRWFVQLADDLGI